MTSGPYDPGPVDEDDWYAGMEEDPVSEDDGVVGDELASAGSRRRRVVSAATLEDWERDHRAFQGGGQWGRRVLAVLGVTFLVAVLLGIGTVVWINSKLGGAGGSAVSVKLPDGADHATLVTDLSKAHVVSDGWLFRRYVDYRSVPPVQGGNYTFHLHEGYRAALHDLAQGPVITQTRFTIPEGYGLQQIAAKVGTLPGLSAQRFLTLATTGVVRSPYEPAGSNNLEGLLFPDTYFISSQDDEQTILQRMVDRFDGIASQVGLDNSAATNGLSPYQTVVLASLIEREAKVEADRGKIARVILNRLKAGMKLQIDATVEYAEGVHKSRLLDSDLATPSPYNTYLVTGLPPGPISAAGQASLSAALNPTPGSWLYYVLISPDGSHGFATTPSQFEQLKAKAAAQGLL